MELMGEQYCAVISYDFKAVLNQGECDQRLQLGFGDESPCRVTVFRWFKEFCRGRSSLQDEEHTGLRDRQRSVCHTKNINGYLSNDTERT
ncbi:histone-lysine N-methyltransferase SETMAR [Trichonephila clavipes]|nr:histone-lysine N-methyltransferase SETMAR [Trichonephila clavipes]